MGDGMLHSMKHSRQVVVAIHDQDLHMWILTQGFRHIRHSGHRSICTPEIISLVLPIPLKSFFSICRSRIAQVFAYAQASVIVIQKAHGVGRRNRITLRIGKSRHGHGIQVDSLVSGIQSTHRHPFTSKKFLIVFSWSDAKVCSLPYG